MKLGPLAIGRVHWLEGSGWHWLALTTPLDHCWLKVKELTSYAQWRHKWQKYEIFGPNVADKYTSALTKKFLELLIHPVLILGIFCWPFPYNTSILCARVYLDLRGSNQALASFWPGQRWSFCFVSLSPTYIKVSLLGVESLWGDSTFTPADWGMGII